MSSQSVIDLDINKIVLTTGSQNIVDPKAFLAPMTMLELQNPFVSKSPPVGRDTTATLSAPDIIGGIVVSNPAGNITLTMPSASSVEGVTGVTQINSGFWVTFINQSAFNVTLAASSDIVLAGCYLTAGNVVIPGNGVANSSRIFRVVKLSNTPSYTLFG